jgi:hypothetical protein
LTLAQTTQEFWYRYLTGRYFSKWRECLWQWVVAQSEVKFWQTQDELGNTWWHAFNPVTKMSVTRESEAEIFAWLDSHSH